MDNNGPGRDCEYRGEKLSNYPLLSAVAKVFVAFSILAEVFVFQVPQNEHSQLIIVTGRRRMKVKETNYQK